MEKTSKKIIDFFITPNDAQFINLVDMMGLNAITVRNLSQFIRILDLNDINPFRVWINIDLEETPTDIYINSRDGKFIQQRFPDIKFQYLTKHYDNVKELDGLPVHTITSLFTLLENKTFSFPINTYDFENKITPTVFISYSWDSESHKKWVLNFANALLRNGIDVILDQYDLSLGKSIHHFMENNIKRANSVVVIFTEKYKKRAEGRIGGVGYEYSILNNHLYKNQTNNLKILPVLKSGSPETSIPDFMQQLLHLDMTNAKHYQDRLFELVKQIYKEPQKHKPSIGKKPKFKSKS